MSEVTEPILLDSTGQEIKDAILLVKTAIENQSGGGSGTGAPGKDGENGATFTPAVSSDGTLSWTNDKGLANPTPVNIKGHKGEQGEAGGDGGYYTPAVTQPNANTLQLYFIPSVSTMPAVNPVQVALPAGTGSGGGESIYIGPDKPTNGETYWLDTSEDTPVIPDTPDVPDVPDEPVIVTYTITNTLTNVTNGNTASSVEENTRYTATLTAANGYEIDTVKVTMGGTDVTSTVYANGVVTIPAVIGNVVITATAKEANAEPEGGIDFSDENVYASAQISSGNGRIQFTNSSAPSYDDFMALEVEKLYFCFAPPDAYKKNIKISASANKSWGTEVLANGVTVAQATSGQYDFVTNAWDKYNDIGYMIYEIDVSALQTKIQTMYDSGTLDSSKTKTLTLETSAAVKSGSTVYCLYNYNG